MVAVLVSGKEALVGQVAAALRARGATATEVIDLADVPAVCAAAGPDAFDAYVQLPAAFEVQGDTAIERVHHFYARGVLARFTTLSAALPSLALDGRVTFVLGQLPPDAATPDDRAARLALTKVLGQAAHADTQDGRLAMRVLDAGSSPDEIATVALGREPTTARKDLEESLSDLSYADWRVELLGLAFVET